MLDGNFPRAGLIEDVAGNLYGTTSLGGTDDNGFGVFGGGGTVFKVDNAGHFSVLYSFCSLGSCTDGFAPKGSLIQDAEGNLYGTTNEGGANTFAGDGNGGGTVTRNRLLFS